MGQLPIHSSVNYCIKWTSYDTLIKAYTWARMNHRTKPLPSLPKHLVLPRHLLPCRSCENLTVDMGRMLASSYKSCDTSCVRQRSKLTREHDSKCQCVKITQSSYRGADYCRKPSGTQLHTHSHTHTQPPLLVRNRMKRQRAAVMMKREEQ